MADATGMETDSGAKKKPPGGESAAGDLGVQFDRGCPGLFSRRDCFDRALLSAGAAVGALVRVYDNLGISLGNALDGAHVLAGSAHRAVV